MHVPMEHAVMSACAAAAGRQGSTGILPKRERRRNGRKAEDRDQHEGKKVAHLRESVPQSQRLRIT